MRFLRAFFRAWWLAAQGRCMVHGVEMDEVPSDVYGVWGSYDLVCPLCEKEKR